MTPSANLLVPATQARRRLALRLFLVGVLLVIAIGVLLWRVYESLLDERRLEARVAAEELVRSVNTELYEILRSEADRPSGEYSFATSITNLQAFSQLKDQGTNSAYQLSPLAAWPPESQLPGLVGYFQLSQDGRFLTPLLPDPRTLNFPLPFSQVEHEERLRQAGLVENALKSSVAAGRQKELHPPAPKRESERTTEGEAALFDSFRQADNLEETQKKPAEKIKPDQRNKGAVVAKESLRGAQAPKLLPQQARKEVFNVLQDQGLAAAGESARFERRTAPSTAPLRRSPPADTHSDLLRIEAEIEPLRLRRLPTGYLCFFRNVWHDGERVVQGFVLKEAEFLAALTEPPLEAGDLRSHLALRLVEGNETIYGSSTSSPEHTSQPLLVSTRLQAPLEGITAEVVLISLPASPARPLFNFLSAALLLLVPLGLTGAYRIGAAEISVAEERSNFVAAVTHELKTPLTSIRMYAEMLLSDWVKDEAKRGEYYRYIHDESERLSRLINNVLFYARLKHGPRAKNDSPESELRPISSVKLLHQAVAKIESHATAQGFQIIILPEVADGSVLANEDLFTQIITNLVDNAVKFSKQSERKEVELSAARIVKSGIRYIAFTVRDFGRGVPPGATENFFKLFHRGDSELTRDTPGVGIGLALVKELAAAMAGQVALRNREPGLEVTVLLPEEPVSQAPRSSTDGAHNT